MTQYASAPQNVHPRSAAATRRRGARLTPVDPQSAPRTYGPAGVQAQPGSARGIILYIGLSEEEAAASGTDLTEIAESLRDYTQELAPSSETQAIIALAPSGPERDLDAVRAVATGSPAARGAAARSHGPVRSRIPSRIHPPQPAEAQKPAAGLKVDLPRREVHIDGRLETVTVKEFDLLATLVSSEGCTLSRAELVDKVWGDDADRPDERTVDVHVRRLRKRLGSYSSVVRTIRGQGYRFDSHPDVEVWSASALR